MRKLLITRHSGRILTGLWEEDRPATFQFYGEDNDFLGNIYIGQVKKILKNIQSAFVDIGDGRLCYLSLEGNERIYRADGKFVEKLVPGDEVVVQVSREAIKTKAPSVTAAWNFTGEYAVLTAQKKGLGISGKIDDSEWTSRAKENVSDLLSEEYGLILRTNAYRAEWTAIRAEIVRLTKQFEAVKMKAVTRTCFSCLYQTPKPYVSEILGLKEEGLEKILTDDREIFEDLRETLGELSPARAERLVYYEDSYPMAKLFSLDTELERALAKNVWLRSGGYLVIEPTEALTVIDVNTGCSEVRKNQQETFLKINLEAAKEAARQIRLRNLSGIVVIDFINLRSAGDRDLVYEELSRECRRDPVKTTVVDRTKLELVEVTRKKIRKPLWEQVRELRKNSERA
jgi:Rne/Rng family ribonuclease